MHAMCEGLFARKLNDTSCTATQMVPREKIALSQSGDMSHASTQP